jgi:hypothetical protein
MRQHDDIIVIRRDGCFILSDGYHNSDVVSELAAGRRLAWPRRWCVFVVLGVCGFQKGKKDR